RGFGERCCDGHGPRACAGPRRERSRAAEGGEVVARDRREGPVQAVRTTTGTVLLSLALAVLSAPREVRAGDEKPPAATDKANEASQHFKSGVAFYKDKDFPAALVEFKRAYELLPNYSVLYNLGQTARELKDYAAALTAFERYLREGGAKIPPPRRKEVTAAVEDLRN